MRPDDLVASGVTGDASPAVPRAVRQSSRSRGYTLLEMLVVLAVLASLTAMSWPAVRTMLAKSALRSAAKQLRAALVEARLDAVESGAVWQFRYRPGTGRFETSATAVLDEESPAAIGDSPSGRPGKSRAREDVLAGDVRFRESAGPARRPGSTAAPETPAGAGWSEPILFFPNGRTSNVRLRLEGERGYTIQVTLRGLTGTTAIGPPEQPAEALP